MPAVKSLLLTRNTKNPEIVGYLPYDCPCSSDQKVCEFGHYNEYYVMNYVDVMSKTIKPKPTATILIDDVSVIDKQLVSKQPSSQCSFKLISDDTPDGTIVSVDTRGQVDIIDGPDEFKLTFNNGETESKTFIVPAQGMKAQILIYGGKFVRPQRFFLRGFII